MPSNSVLGCFLLILSLYATKVVIIQAFASPTLKHIPHPLYGSVVSQILSKGVSKIKIQNQQSISPSQSPTINDQFLRGALAEALYRQKLILDTLEKQELTEVSLSLEKRRHAINDNIKQLLLLQKHVDSSPSSSKSKTIVESNLQYIYNSLLDLGHASILHLAPRSWKHNKDEYKKNEFGRPKDWNGLVFHSPLGVPILVGKKGSHNDDVLRRISQGSDLWFQIEDYTGSRVLLRTSLMRGLKNSKVCMQMAADLAAYYSDYQTYTNVPIMYTDSRHVAKRGSKAGQMRRKKSLGRMYGCSDNVIDIASGHEP